ncbi:MAG: site-specific DNA-methyltransferase [Coleofasciculaceae cyanobacterium RL_1_1]|nr:site-specific DNA-methyltransferase [Coleofasciculaceae cyanobacterium RL_1_1]
MPPKKKSNEPKKIESLEHEATRKHIPTAEFEPMLRSEDDRPLRVAYERRNRDLDPQLVWRGKDVMDWSDLVVDAPPLYIQEKIKPKALIDDLRRRSRESSPPDEEQLDLFADFDGLPESVAGTEFYEHDAHWSNRMILGDSLQVMASLAEREGLRGKVQCIYLDPPYGIKFNSNFQWSTTSRDVKDGKAEHITREPEQVKAFRDTWRDGIHSYLTYLRDRLTVARDLLSDSGSIFVQIGDENVHRVRALMDEVFGEKNCISQIIFVKTSGYGTKHLTGISDYLLFYAKDIDKVKYRQINHIKEIGGSGIGEYKKAELPNGVVENIKASDTENAYSLPSGTRFFRPDNITTQGNPTFRVEVNGRLFSGSYKTNLAGMEKLRLANRLLTRKTSLGYKRYLDDFAAFPINNTWIDTGIAGRPGEKVYVVQTATKVSERCILMTTDPGDLVLDPTCLRQGTKILIPAPSPIGGGLGRGQTPPHSARPYQPP